MTDNESEREVELAMNRKPQAFELLATLPNR